jgi:2-amino-4-hydroxy-6-hydroxymethyldihydropteridine diphosphokinase
VPRAQERKSGRPRMTEVFVAAGSNIEPLRNLRAALAGLERAYPSLRISPAYRNKAVGFEGDDFVNLVVGFATNDSLEQVRAHLQRIEADCGRPRDAPKWASRSMDLDILMFGEEIRNEPGLTLPRPDLVKRPYMLKPIVDIAPDVRHPTLHRTMRELWDAFEGTDHQMTVVTLS